MAGLDDDQHPSVQHFMQMSGLLRRAFETQEVQHIALVECPQVSSMDIDEGEDERYTIRLSTPHYLALLSQETDPHLVREFRARWDVDGAPQMDVLCAALYLDASNDVLYRLLSTISTDNVARCLTSEQPLAERTWITSLLPRAGYEWLGQVSHRIGLPMCPVLFLRDKLSFIRMARFAFDHIGDALLTTGRLYSECSRWTPHGLSGVQCQDIPWLKILQRGVQMAWEVERLHAAHPQCKEYFQVSDHWSTAQKLTIFRMAIVGPDADYALQMALTDYYGDWDLETFYLIFWDACAAGHLDVVALLLDMELPRNNVNADAGNTMRLHLENRNSDMPSSVLFWRCTSAQVIRTVLNIAPNIDRLRSVARHHGNSLMLSVTTVHLQRMLDRGILLDHTPDARHTHYSSPALAQDLFSSAMRCGRIDCHAILLEHQRRHVPDWEYQPYEYIPVMPHEMPTKSNANARRYLKHIEKMRRGPGAVAKVPEQKMDPVTLDPAFTRIAEEFRADRLELQQGIPAAEVTDEDLLTMMEDEHEEADYNRIMHPFGTHSFVPDN